jgi:hypothetical protein
MLMPLVTLPSADSAERTRILAVNEMRERALERLYERRAAVEDLIRSLEIYEKAQSPSMAECLDFSSGRKCS